MSRHTLYQGANIDNFCVHAGPLRGGLRNVHDGTVSDDREIFTFFDYFSFVQWNRVLAIRYFAFRV